MEKNNSKLIPQNSALNTEFSLSILHPASELENNIKHLIGPFIVTGRDNPAEPTQKYSSGNLSFIDSTKKGSSSLSYFEKNLGTIKPEKRGRKATPQTDEEIGKKKRMRAEKNKLYAQESRNRQREYVLQLETEMKSLKLELDTCKEKLAQYESQLTLEKLIKLIETEFHHVYNKYMEELFVQIQACTTPELIELNARKYNAVSLNLMEIINQIFLEVTVPCSMKRIVWRKIEKLNSTKNCPIHKLEIADPEDINYTFNMSNLYKLDIMKNEELRSFYANYVRNSGRALRLFAQSFNILLRERNLLNEMHSSLIFSKASSSSLKSYIHWAYEISTADASVLPFYSTQDLFSSFIYDEDGNDESDESLNFFSQYDFIV